MFLYPHAAHGTYAGTYVVALLDPLVYHGRLRALASLDVRVTPGPPKVPLKEMFRVARALKFAKHKMNDLVLNEKTLDLKFSLGSRAALKHDVDISLEFALLPDA